MEYMHAREIVKDAHWILLTVAPPRGLKFGGGSFCILFSELSTL
jgi:hypothetical protein